MSKLIRTAAVLAWLPILAGLGWPDAVAAGQAGAPAPRPLALRVERASGTADLDADRVPLREVLSRLAEASGFDISGLDKVPPEATVSGTYTSVAVSTLLARLLDAAGVGYGMLGPAGVNVPARVVMMKRSAAGVSAGAASQADRPSRVVDDSRNAPPLPTEPTPGEASSDTPRARRGEPVPDDLSRGRPGVQAVRPEDVVMTQPGIVLPPVPDPTALRPSTPSVTPSAPAPAPPRSTAQGGGGGTSVPGVATAAQTAPATTATPVAPMPPAALATPPVRPAAVPTGSPRPGVPVVPNPGQPAPPIPVAPGGASGLDPATHPNAGSPAAGLPIGPQPMTGPPPGTPPITTKPLPPTTDPVIKK